MTDTTAPNPPPPGVTLEICLDVCDVALVATFWSDLLGYRVLDAFTETWVHTDPPAGFPVLNFQTVPEAKVGKNRLHFDVFTTEPETWIAKAQDLGAAKVTLHDDPADWFQVMADPEGNEFCICWEQQPRPST